MSHVILTNIETTLPTAPKLSSDQLNKMTIWPHESVLRGSKSTKSIEIRTETDFTPNWRVFNGFCRQNAVKSHGESRRRGGKGRGREKKGEEEGRGGKRREKEKGRERKEEREGRRDAPGLSISVLFFFFFFFFIKAGVGGKCGCLSARITVDLLRTPRNALSHTPGQTQMHWKCTVWRACTVETHNLWRLSYAYACPRPRKSCFGPPKYGFSWDLVTILGGQGVVYFMKEIGKV